MNEKGSGDTTLMLPQDFSRQYDGESSNIDNNELFEELDQDDDFLQALQSAVTEDEPEEEHRNNNEVSSIFKLEISHIIDD